MKAVAVTGTLSAASAVGAVLGWATGHGVLVGAATALLVAVSVCVWRACRSRFGSITAAALVALGVGAVLGVPAALSESVEAGAALAATGMLMVAVAVLVISPVLGLRSGAAALRRHLARRAGPADRAGAADPSRS